MDTQVSAGGPPTTMASASPWKRTFPYERHEILRRRRNESCLPNKPTGQFGGVCVCIIKYIFRLCYVIIFSIFAHGRCVRVQKKKISLFMRCRSRVVNFYVFDAPSEGGLWVGPNIVRYVRRSTRTYIFVCALFLYYFSHSIYFYLYLLLRMLILYIFHKIFLI